MFLHIYSKPSKWRGHINNIINVLQRTSTLNQRLQYEHTMASKRLINLIWIRRKTHSLHIKMVFWKTYVFFKEALELQP